MKNIILALSLVFLSSFALATEMGTPISTRLYIKFKDGSSKFEPQEDVINTLLEARSAAIIYIGGRTSTTKPSPQDEALAFKRAAAARAYLINLGVSPLKIMINYVSSADFIADNATLEGREKNQRVDIEMIFVPNL